MITAERITYVLLVVLSIAACDARADAEADIAASFEQFASKEISRASHTYEGRAMLIHSDDGQWRKVVHTLDPKYSIDVKRTDSLISPFVAYLTVVKGENFYKSSTTKGVAAKATEIAFRDESPVRLTYTYQKHVWVLKKSEYMVSGIFSQKQSWYESLYSPNKSHPPEAEETFWWLRRPEHKPMSESGGELP